MSLMYIPEIWSVPRQCLDIRSDCHEAYPVLSMDDALEEVKCCLWRVISIDDILPSLSESSGVVEESVRVN